MKYRNKELQTRLLNEGVTAFGYSLIPKIVLEDHRLHASSKLIYMLIFSTLAEGDGKSVESTYICDVLNLSQKEYIAGIEDLLENGYLHKNENNSVTMASNPLHLSEINFKKAMERREYWLAHKDEYLICDTEGTANRANELVEVSMIDLDGNILYNSLIRPRTSISRTGVRLHGITNEMVADAPTWEEASAEVRALLDQRIMLAFDSISDVLRIKKTSALYDMQFGPIRHECIQRNVMLERNLKQAPPLYMAAGREGQNHRALDDCLLCIDIIRRIYPWPGSSEETQGAPDVAAEDARTEPEEETPDIPLSNEASNPEPAAPESAEPPDETEA